MIVSPAIPVRGATRRHNVVGDERNDRMRGAQQQLEDS